MSDSVKDRMKVATLLRNVRLGNMTVSQAMLNYPKDTNDESLIAAYHALIHYEADEDIRMRDEAYKNEQDDYIEFISGVLSRGDDLPQNIIDTYKNYYKTAPILHEHNIDGFFKSFWKTINLFK